MRGAALARCLVLGLVGLSIPLQSASVPQASVAAEPRLLQSASVPQASVPSVQFHHLHLRDSPPAVRIASYERLFDRSVTRRLTFAGADGLQMGSRLILVSQATAAA